MSLISMADTEEFLRLTADAKDKMNKFHSIVYLSMAAHISPPAYNAVVNTRRLKLSSHEGLAYKESVERLRRYNSQN